MWTHGLSQIRSCPGRMPALTTRLAATMSYRIREGTRIERQRRRLVLLGKLSARACPRIE
jgi:hypothetical protein